MRLASPAVETVPAAAFCRPRTSEVVRSWTRQPAGNHQAAFTHSEWATLSGTSRVPLGSNSTVSLAVVMVTVVSSPLHSGARVASCVKRRRRCAPSWSRTPITHLEHLSAPAPGSLPRADTPASAAHSDRCSAPTARDRKYRSGPEPRIPGPFPGPSPGI